MPYFIIIMATILVSTLTFLSGFGLGTLLLPVFLLYFPVDVAIAATAIVHLANNLFKAVLIGPKADLKIVAAFSLPAALMAIIGALLLEHLSHLPALGQYQALGHTFSISPIKLVVAALMALFAWLELSPGFQHLAFPPKWIPLGGALSGFFGGLTGHQGALRAAFLIRLGLDKETFIGTTVLSAIVIDLSRLIVYGVTFFAGDFGLLLKSGEAGLILAGIGSAFLGAVLGARFIQKVTFSTIQKLVGGLLVIYAVLLGSGLI